MLTVFDLQMQTRIAVRYEPSFFQNKESDFPNRWQVLFKWSINEKNKLNVFRQKKTGEDKVDMYE